MNLTKIATILLFLSLVACSKSSIKASLPQKTPPIPEAPTLDTASSDSNETRLMGQVISPGRMLLSFKAIGTIQKLNAQPGMSFKKGQVLAELDTRDLSLRAESARLRYDQALNQKKMAERDFEIEKALNAKQISSKLQFENAQTNYENASLNARMADVDLRTAQRALEDSKLLAPFDCTIIKQMKSLGESSDAGATYEIYETASLQIHLQVPESMLGKIKVGDTLEVDFPALSVKLPAKVIRFVPVVSEQTRNFLVVAELEKPDERIVPGYFAEGILK